MNRSTGTRCEVSGCEYNWRKLTTALNQSCVEHFPIERYECDVPFAFYRTPSEPDLNKHWLVVLQLKNHQECLCALFSFHWYTAFRCHDNPISELYLGYERKAKLKKR